MRFARCPKAIYVLYYVLNIRILKSTYDLNEKETDNDFLKFKKMILECQKNKTKTMLKISCLKDFSLRK